MSIRFLTALFLAAPAFAFEVPAINDVKVARPEQWLERDGRPDSKVPGLYGDVESPSQLGLGFAGFTQAGERYYAKWTFRRLGTLSKNTEICGGRTATVRFVP